MTPEELEALMAEPAPAAPQAPAQAQPAPSGVAPAAPTQGPAQSTAAPAAPAGRLIDRLDPAGQIGGAIVTGAAKSIYETKDFLFGQTAEADKSELRRNIETLDKDLGNASIANSFVAGLSQFATGMLGAGKLVGLAKAVPVVGGAVGGLEATRKGAAVLSSAKAAAVGAVAFDPSGPRLSDLVQKFPALQNPVSEFLASQPGDTRALGRAKNALESIGVDAALAGVFAASVVGFKALRSGEQAVTEGALRDLSAAVAHKDAKLAASKGDLETVEALRQEHPEAVKEAVDALRQPAEDGATLEHAIATRDEALWMSAKPDDYDEVFWRQEFEEAINPPTPWSPTESARKAQEAVNQNNWGPDLQTESGRTANHNDLQPTDRQYKEAKSAWWAIQSIHDGPYSRERVLRLFPEEHRAEAEAILRGGPDGSLDQPGELWDLYRRGNPGGAQAADPMYTPGEAAIPRSQRDPFEERYFGADARSRAAGPGDFPTAAANDGAPAAPAAGPPDALASDAMSARSPRRSLAEREAAGETIDYGPTAPVELQEVGGQPSVPSVPQAQDALSSEAMSAKPPTRPNRAAELDGDIALPAIDVPPEAPTVTRVDSPTQGSGPEGLPAKPRLIPVSEEQVTKLISDGITDTVELMGPGGWDGAVARGHRFGDGGSIPWQKLHADLGMGDQGQEGPMGAMVGRVAEMLEPQLNKAKGGNAEGVLTDAAVDRLVGQRVTLYNEDPQALLGALQVAGKNAKTMVANMEAAQLIGNRAMLDTLNLRSRIQLGMLEEFDGDLGKAREALMQHLEVASSFWAEGQAMRASAGRALRRNRAEFAFTAEDLAAMKGLDDARFFNLLDAVGHDFQVATKLIKPGFWSRLKDDAAYLYVNNLLWGLRTHFVNTLTNSYMLVGRPMERIIGHGILGDKAAVQENARQYGYMAASIQESWRDAVRTWKTGDSIMSPHTAEISPQGTADATNGTNWVAEGYKQWDSVPNILSNAYTGFMKAAGTPTRLLGTMDELAKQVTYRSKVMASAHADGIAAGLEGQALKDHVRSTLLNAFDDAGRAVDLRALEEANIATFQQDLLPSTFGKTVQTAVANHELLRYVVPFVKTPTNVLRLGWKMTPGLNMAQTEYRQMIRGDMGPEKQAQAVGQMAMGSLFMGAAATLAIQGHITGGGPSDQQLRQTLMATGWQPYSFVIANEDGTKRYVNFGRYDPVAMPMGIIADIIDIVSRDQDGDGFGEQAWNAAAGLGIALAKQITSKTYLTSLNDTLQAITEPDKKMERAVGQTASNFVPFASGLRFANPDPLMRDARGVVDKIMATVPGLSEKLPPKRDVFGDPLTVHKGLWVDGELSAVDAEVRRMIDESLVAPLGPPSPDHKGTDLRDVVMVDGRNAFDRYQELAGHPTRGPSLKETVAKVMRTEAYRRAPDGEPETKGTRAAMLTGTVAKYRDAALKALKADANVRAALAKRDQEARAAVAKAYAPKSNTQTGAEQLHAIGKAAGVDLSGFLPQ